MQKDDNNNNKNNNNNNWDASKRAATWRHVPIARYRLNYIVPPPLHSSILYNKFRRIEREREFRKGLLLRYFYYLSLLFLLLFHSELHARNCVLLYWDGKVRESWEFLEIGEIRDLYFYAKSNFSRTRRLDSFLQFVYDRRCFEFRGLLWASFQTARGLKTFSSFILCLVFC